MLTIIDYSNTAKQVKSGHLGEDLSVDTCRYFGEDRNLDDIIEEESKVG